MNLPEYNARIATHKIPLVVDFWAPWCGPCKAMNPILTRVSAQHKGKVDLLKVNVDESPEIARDLKVMGIPTTIGYSAGKQVFRKTGFQSEAVIEKLFNDLAQGKTVSTPKISNLNRILRLVSGGALIVLGAYRGPSILLIVLGALVAFTAVYDRCPIYKAVSGKIKEAFQKTGVE